VDTLGGTCVYGNGDFVADTAPNGVTQEDTKKARQRAIANARLIAAAPDLLGEAQLLRCLATSPRFQEMTVREALAELKLNGMGHDDGAALAKASG
jgi:hypothetical protein